MIFPYPALHKDATVYRCRRGHRVWFEGENKDGERVPVSAQISELLTQLEGGHINPYRLPGFSHYTEEEMDRLLLRLVRCGLLRKHGRVNRYLGPLFLVSLVPVQLHRTRAICWMTLFLLFALPVAFLSSLFLLPSRFDIFGYSPFSETTLTALGALILLLGCLLHELGHGISAAAMGGSTAEIGALTFFCLPIGFYLAYQENINSSRFAKFTVSVSGASMNALTALICLLFCGHAGPLDDALLLGAVNNLILVAFNLLPCPILDGGTALEALTGINDIHRKALSFLFSARERQHIVRRQPSQVFCIIGAYLVAGLGFTTAVVWTVVSVLNLLC